MPSEKSIANKLKRLQGKEVEEETEQEKPLIVKRAHPQQNKLYYLVGASALAVLALGIFGFWLTIRYQDQPSIMEKISALRTDVGNSVDDLIENQPALIPEFSPNQEGAPEVVSNPNNLSDEEIESMENKVFPEIKQ